jgi:hypothetical protein
MKRHSEPIERCANCTAAIRSNERLGIVGLNSWDRKLHRQAIARRERDQAMRDCGLVKVRGGLRGTYWE